MVKLTNFNASGMGITIEAGSIGGGGDSDTTLVDSYYLGNNEYFYHYESDSGEGFDGFDIITWEKGDKTYVERVTYFEDGKQTIEMRDMKLTLRQLVDGFSSVLSGNDTIVGNKYNDVIYAFSGDDVVIGNGGNDRLYGGAGKDAISGGRGRDKLSGNSGADRFIFNDGDTGLGKSGWDVITDFKAGQDRINLQKIDANLRKGGDQTFDFSGHHAGKYAVWTTTSGNDLIVHGDNSGDAQADFEIYLNGVHSLKEADFLL